MLVLRSSFDRVCRERDEARGVAAVRVDQVRQLQQEVEWLRSQIVWKDAEVLALRREGFDPAGPGMDRDPVPIPGLDLPPEVRNAMEEVSDPGDTLWLSLARDAQADLDHGAKPDEIAKGIRKGSTLNPFHP